MEVEMSVAGIATTAFSTLGQIQHKYQSVQGEFKQLGQDLSSGNLTKAQTDFVTLSQSAASGQMAANPTVNKALNTLGQALQSGDLSAAQQAYATMPPIPAATTVKEQYLASHHTHPGADSASSTAQQSSTIGQILTQMGQALQSGSLTAAQQAFAAMKQNW